MQCASSSSKMEGHQNILEVESNQDTKEMKNDISMMTILVTIYMKGWIIHRREKVRPCFAIKLKIVRLGTTCVSEVMSTIDRQF